MIEAMTSTTKLNVFAWLLVSTVSITSIIVWGHYYNWHIIGLSTYHIFPIFGLLAFGLMWSHYVVSVLRQHLKLDKSAVATYFEFTSYVVLALILLHPGLLIWQLWRDGYGFPPQSYIHYVDPGLKLFVLLGTLNWFIFIAYEFRRKFVGHSWWRFFGYATDIAMVGVFYHALRLGTLIKHGWFRGLWFFYGASLVLCLIYIHHKGLFRLVGSQPRSIKKALS